MSPTLSELSKIHELHRSGKLELAKKLCKKLLANYPENSEALHALGLILVEQNHLEEALQYLQKAVQLSPQPQFQLHLANTFKMIGAHDKAIETLKNTIEKFPNYSAAYNNLGTLYYAQKKIKEAIHHYQLAINKKNDYIDAYYNLGLALTKKNDFDNALSAFQKVLDYLPEHSAAQFQLARIVMQKGLWDKALFILKGLAAQHPYHTETQVNLGTCYLKQGALQEAKNHYLKALALDPQDSQVLFNLGHIHMQESDTQQAARYYQAVIALNPNDFASHNNLGAIYIFQKNPELALHHFEKALKIQPENVYIGHVISILKNDQHIDATPPAYLQVLFDYYADHYETHLMNNLGYRTPQILMESMLEKQLLPDTEFTILDIGCGTGLCGETFKPYAAYLTGVDLSAEMLKVASAKNIYNELVQDDYLQYLSKKHHSYDLITAADVLIYTGDLSTVFRYTKQALRPGGFFAFNTEISDNKDYAIHASGRFAHSCTYLDKIIEINGLEIVNYRITPARSQNYQPVSCHVYLLKAS